MKRSWRVSVVVLVFAVVAAACTSGGGNDQNNGNSSGSSGPIKLTMWIGYTPPPPGEPIVRVPVDRPDGQGVRGGQSGHHDRAAVREQRQRAAEGDGRDPGQPAARHLLPVRHEHGAARPDPEDRRPDGSGAVGGLQLERLLPRRAGGRDRRRPRARRPGARRQPGGRLQQGPVRQGRHPRTHGRLDVGRPARRREGDHRPREQGVRAGVPGGRQRDHGVGVRGHALGGRRRDPEQRQHEGRVQLGGRRSRAHDAHRHQPGRLDVPGLPPRLRQVRDSCSTRARSG